MHNYIKTHIFSLILFSTIFLAFFLRTYLLSSVPPNLHVDEISFGYNAYSLLQTGKDEFGVSLPLVLRSFDDYRPAIFSYLLIPFIKLFGLEVTSIRMTSVVLSLVTCFCLYTITIMLLRLSTLNKKQLPSHKYIALSAIFLYAICPWSIFMSRLAIDSNASLAFFMTGLVFFLSFLLKPTSWKLPLSFLFFTLSIYSYNGIKAFLPVFLIVCLAVFFKELYRQKKTFVFSLIFLLVTFTPLISMLGNKTNRGRFTYLNAFTHYQPVFQATSAERLLYDHQHGDQLGYVFDNRRFASFPFFITNYLLNLNPSWLYTDDLLHHNYKVPDLGLFYFFELPLFVFGIYTIIIKKLLSRKITFLLLAWFFLSIIPAAITIDTPSAVRIYTILPVFLIVEACALYDIITSLLKQKNRPLKFFLCVGCGGFVTISVLWFFHVYFTLFPYYMSDKYQYGVVEALQYARQHESEYQGIVVSNREDLAYSYIYYLFFTKYSPEKYLNSGGTRDGSIFANHVIDNYIFVDPAITQKEHNVLTYNEKFLTKNTLYVVNNTELPPSEPMRNLFLQKVTILKRISYSNSTPAITIFKAK